MSDQRHLVLVGLMGAGKTTVGERCARRLGRPFVDTDDLVESVSGATVAQLFATEGEAGFRARERTAVADACASPVATVIGCGGGAVLDPKNRRALRACGFVVWLRAAPEVLAERVAGDAPDRPLLSPGSPPQAPARAPAGPAGVATTLERLAGTRAAAYEAVADTEIETGGRTVDDVTDAVLEVYSRCHG
jgi:shikimate kinase